MVEYLNCRNPVFPPDLCIPDPEAHVMPDGRVYVYGSWDQEQDVFCSSQYRVLSTSNMINWTDHGISFDSSGVEWLHDKNAEQYPNVDWDFTDPPPYLLSMMERLAKRTENKADGNAAPITSPPPIEGRLYAPDAIHKDGRYYLYFCCADNSEGVASSDRPEGPFVDPVRIPVGGIDPAVYINDDGQAYYFWGQFRASGGKLKPSMLELERDSIVNRLVTEEEHGFHEGSSLRKHNGLYYFVYPCVYRDNKPTSLAYATSKNPLGPYTYRGIIIDNAKCDPESWNIHGSIEKVNGQWYVFYHRSSQGSQYMRRMCVEPIHFNNDGSIDEVAMTSIGAGRPFEIGEVIDGWRACELHGSSYISGTVLTNIKDGDRAIIRFVDFSRSPKDVEVTAKGSGTISVYSNSILFGNIRCEDGTVKSSEVSCAAGMHEIELVFSEVNGLTLQSLTFI